jgi:shikimate dehydrogenase
LPFLDAVSDEAAEIGAVNCVKVVHGVEGRGRAGVAGVAGVRLYGYNTDVYGFSAGLDELLGAGQRGDLRALVLGTGGASAAVQYVLKRRNIEYQVVSRTAGEERPGDVNSKQVLTYTELTPEIVAANKLIINATPLGTRPDTESKPDLPYEAVGEGHFLYDLVYNPPLTAFLAEGARRGAATLNGETMLHAQAEKAWGIWNTSVTQDNS